MNFPILNDLLFCSLLCIVLRHYDPWPVALLQYGLQHEPVISIRVNGEKVKLSGDLKIFKMIQNIRWPGIRKLEMKLQAVSSFVKIPFHLFQVPLFLI